MESNCGTWVNVRWFAPFGTACDGTVNWQPYIQAAVDYIIKKSLADLDLDVVGTLFIPAGKYKIDMPIQIINLKGTAYQACSIQIIGDARGYTSTANHGSVILPSYNNKPAIVIETARVVRIKNLLIYGVNNWTDGQDLTDPVIYYNDDNFLVNGAVDNRYAPYAGICIDPYNLPAPPTLYPDLSTFYTTGASSSDILIEDCEIFGFAVGVMISLDLHLQNAENITIRKSSINSNKYAISVGQEQVRGLTLEAVDVSGAMVGITCVDHGTQGGDCPSIFGGNFDGMKYLFNVTSVGASPSINGLYAEAVMSLGQFVGGQTSDGYAFSGCSFSFLNTPTGHPAMNTHLSNLTQMVFTGCNFVNGNSTSEPIRFFNLGRLAFNSCVFARNFPDMAPVFWITGVKEQVMFNNTMMQDKQDATFVTKSPLSNVQPVGVLDNYFRSQALPGAFVYSSLSDVNLLWISGIYPTFALGTVALTVNTDGTATFTMTDPTSILQVGDLVSSDYPFNFLLPPSSGTAGTLIIGKVYDISGTTVTLTFVPEYLTTIAALPIYGVYFPRVHPATVGAVANSTVITSVMDPVTSADVGWGWKVGHRIRGVNIPEGAYITAVDLTAGNNKLTLSIATTAGMTAITTRLYDADQRVISTTEM